MPRFVFEPLKKVKLQENVADEPVLSPALVVQSRAESMDETQVCPNPVEIVRSRKTRPVDWTVLASAVVVSSPVIMLASLLVCDSFSRDYCSAELHRLLKDDRGAVTLLSSALKTRPDNIALRVRADCYASLKDRQSECADLWTLVQRRTHEYRVYPRAAAALAKDGSIAKAVRVYQIYAEREQTFDQFYEREEAAYNLLLLGELDQSKKLLQEVATPKNKDSARTQILTALTYRESGDTERARQSIASLKDKHTSTFKDSRIKYDQKAVPLTIQTLLHLDNNQPKEARALMDKLLPMVKKNSQYAFGKKSVDTSEPILDVLQGWLLLEEGRLADCVRLTDTALKSKDLDSTIVGLNIQAALHLIRQEVFLRQNRSADAAAEGRLYAQTHCSGLIFQPMCFRKAKP